MLNIADFITSPVFDRWFSCLKSQHFTPIQDMRQNEKHTQHTQKRENYKSDFSSEKNFFELLLRKEKLRQVVFKLSFQDIGILGPHCTLHLLKSEAPL